MNYIKLINKINEELEEKGVKSIYDLVASNIDINVIRSIMEKNTKEFCKLDNNEKKNLISYIKGLSLQSKLIGII